jgi:hypothetical protein
MRARAPGCRRFGPSRLLAVGAVAVVLATTAKAAIVEMTLPELVAGSEMIVRGEVSALDSRWSDARRRLIVTDVTIDIRELSKGILDSSQVVVTVLGGVIGELGLLVEDQPRFRIGQQVILFLRPPDDQGERTVTNLYHGAYTIRDDRILETGESRAQFEARIDEAVRAQEERQQ